MEKSVANISIAPELWASSIFPEGILEKWLAQNGTVVKAGAPVASVRIEDALHELIAPTGGRLTADMMAGSVVDPGTIIGRIVS